MNPKISIQISSFFFLFQTRDKPELQLMETGSLEVSDKSINFGC